MFLAACAGAANNSYQSPDRGYVTMSFDINEQGSAENTVVFESSHDGIFEQEALRALKAWQYHQNC
ncbi:MULTISPECIES: energy transducer TonB [Pseudoalteromonas]|uniref:energy transducer TonB n=1 Tax=Pseudoalteromonas TaxID=53246 RepID=UPI0023E3CDED|nr:MULTISPECIES: TonB family protein [Pseudoalteromonas]